MMDLRHYASQPMTLDGRIHKQDKGMKPSGLWVSDGTEWLDWCRSEEFRSDTNWYEHAVDVAPVADILELKTPGDIDAFTRRYGEPISPKWDSRYVDWARVAADYDGILISPYQWSRRSEPHTFWYYGWDVAGGCIWNPRVVSLGSPVEVSFEQVQS